MIGSYSVAPSFAWAGWRLRVPGAPPGGGGQYHGYLASDDVVDGYGWPAGHAEIYRPSHPQEALGIYPWHHWDHGWHGTAYKEGETPSDMVFRGPAEVRPRPNASGGVNVVRAVQTMRTPGYAVAPGNYKALGAVPAMPPFFHTAPICPAWGCGTPPWARGGWDGIYVPAPASPAPAPVVTQPPPPTGPTPTSIVQSTGCPVGQYQDQSGNCTSDWRNPYPMYLPLDPMISPAPTVAASTSPTGVCPTGYTTDANGNCVVSGVAPSGGSITDWLGASTAIGGMAVPNFVLLGGVLLVAMKFMHK